MCTSNIVHQEGVLGCFCRRRWWVVGPPDLQNSTNVEVAKMMQGIFTLRRGWSKVLEEIEKFLNSPICLLYIRVQGTCVVFWGSGWVASVRRMVRFGLSWGRLGTRNTKWNSVGTLFAKWPRSEWNCGGVVSLRVPVPFAPYQPTCLASHGDDDVPVHVA